MNEENNSAPYYSDLRKRAEELLLAILQEQRNTVPLRWTEVDWTWEGWKRAVDAMLAFGEEREAAGRKGGIYVRHEDWLKSDAESRAAARAEAAELERKGVALCAQNGELLIEMHGLRAEVEALRADFFEYAHHLAGLPSCGKNPGAMEMTSRKCDCGLDAARARWEKKPE